MTSFVAQRLGHSAATIFGVVTLVFFLLPLVPGDPIDLMLGESALPAQRDQMRTALRLDRPIVSRYFAFVGDFMKGDLGHSLTTGEPVLGRIVRALPATLKLSLASLALALCIALPAGLLAASRQGSAWDSITMGSTLVGLSMPAFWFGPLLILLFSFYLGWFPLSGNQEPYSLVLPAITLGTGMAALLARMTRASALNVLREDYVRTARAKGLAPSRVWICHVLRNALLPVVTVAALQTGALLAGSIITETVFSWPGLGLELVEAIERRDYPMVQGCVLVIACSYVLIHTVTDLVYGAVDPRIRISALENK